MGNLINNNQFDNQSEINSQSNVNLLGPEYNWLRTGYRGQNVQSPKKYQHIAKERSEY
jgi:hypothetical protein